MGYEKIQIDNTSKSASYLSRTLIHTVHVILNKHYYSYILNK